MAPQKSLYDVHWKKKDDQAGLLLLQLQPQGGTGLKQQPSAALLSVAWPGASYKASLRTQHNPGSTDSQHII